MAFDQPPLTRKERANNVYKRNYFTKYSKQTRKAFDALLDKFADEGVDDIEDIGLLKVRPLTHHGSPIEIIKTFGGSPGLARLPNCPTGCWTIALGAQSRAACQGQDQ